MISAVSRFRVRNGMEKDVERAFLDRPRLVDRTAGFLGMEVFTDSGDAAVFYLVTRWTDEPAFRAWHGSPAHRMSHRGIPGGLKLDAAYTRVTVLERLHDDRPAVDWGEIVADAAPALGRYLATGTRGIHCLTASPGGAILACNAAGADSLGVPAAALIGTAIWDHLAPGDGDALRARLAPDRAAPGEPLLLNFLDALGHPFTLECSVEVRPDGFLLLGEKPRHQEDALRDELLGMNNQLATLTRENERKRRALARTAEHLERTLSELNSSHWHLKKIQEVLPVCMSCGRVRNVEGGWEEVIEYLREHALFLSDTYCPPCMERFDAEADLASDA